MMLGTHYDLQIIDIDFYTLVYRALDAPKAIGGKLADQFSWYVCTRKAMCEAISRSSCR
jgi:hypothetical protein